MKTTTAKTIIKKDTGAFVHYLGDGQFGTSEVPKLIAKTATMKIFKKYLETNGERYVVPMMKDYRIVKVTVTVPGYKRKN